MVSQIEDDEQRTRDTIAYLKTLPPWPAPLPWDIPSLAPTDPPLQLSDLDAVPQVEPSADGIDLAHSPIDAADRADPIKRRIYAKLPDAVEVLYRFGNRYAEIKAPTDALRTLVAVDFDDADLLDIHLQIAALTDARDLDAQKPAHERFDADCLATLNSVLRLGPPVTLGHPDVDLLEQRSAEYARNRLPATVAEGERRMAKGIAASPRVAKERLRKVAGQVANAPDTGRVAEYRRALHKNTVLALAYVAGAIADASTGFVFGEVTVAAAQFLLAHKDAIMATAPSWGETGYRWLEYIIIRADQIVREARGGDEE
jgi:internalin A